MISGMDHVFQAVQLLVGRNAMVEERFCEAAREFVAALRQSDQWPEGLLEKALDIEKRLTAAGGIEETIRAMDPPAVEAVAEEILDLAEAIVSRGQSNRDAEETEDEEILALSTVRFHNGHLRKGKRFRHQGRHLRLCRC